MGTESEVVMNKHALSASLLFETKAVLFHARLSDDVQQVFC